MEPVSVSIPFRQDGTILEVGGGDTPLFRPNLDMRKLPTVDIVCDLEEKWPIPDSSYDGVFGKFVIEHMSWRKIPHFASECFRVLKPGGAVMLVGPNTLEQCREIARLGKIGIEESSLLYGGQEEKGWNEHKAALSPEYAIEVFKKAGFGRVEIKTWPGQIWTGARTDMIIEAYKGASSMSTGINQQGWYQDLEKSLASKPIGSQPTDKVKLNIGSFTVMFKDWVNCDILDLSAYAQQNGFIFRQFDARQGIPWPDNSVDAIIASHFIEHLTRAEGDKFLRECLRVLKPNGIIRLTIPDARVIASYYVEKSIKGTFNENEGVKNAEDEAEAFWNLLTAGHTTAYDSASLITKMKGVGFTEVMRQNPGQSMSYEVQNETKDMYPEHSSFIEGLKANVVAMPGPVSLPTPNNHSLKVGLISTQFFGVPPKGYAGLERIVWDLACGLAELGHEVTIFAPEGSKKPPRGHVVTTGPALSTVNVDWLKVEEDACKVYEPHLKDLDIIHGHNWFGFEFFAKSRNFSLKCCHTHHGHMDPNWWLRSRPPFKLNFIALSQYMQREYAQQGMPSQHVYNGVDLEKYQYKEQKGDRLIFVGRLDNFKQPHIAIELAKRLNMGLDIFGGSFVYDVAYMERIKSMCDGTQVILYLDASQTKKVEFLQNAKCLIFPSQMAEPFGLVAAEAMACGTPVVSTSDGAIGEVVHNGLTGYVCQNISEMEEAVKKISSIKPTDCRRIVEEKFSRQVMAKNYDLLYRKILRGEEW